MLPSALREAPKKKAEKKRTNNRSPHFLKKDKYKSNSKRMAQVASVYEIARFRRQSESRIEEFFAAQNSKKKSKRPRPKAKRVWARLDKSGEEVINEIFKEALRRDPDSRPEWVVLVDGDPHQIKKFQK